MNFVYAITLHYTSNNINTPGECSNLICKCISAIDNASRNSYYMEKKIKYG